MGACRSKSAVAPRAVLVWVPLVTKIGPIFYLDRGKSCVNGLRAASYVAQSEDYVFRVGSGAVGRCHVRGSEYVVIEGATRFDEFHRTVPALQNGVKCVYLCKDGERILEYVNARCEYASTEDVVSYEEVVRGMAGAGAA